MRHRLKAAVKRLIPLRVWDWIHARRARGIRPIDLTRLEALRVADVSALRTPEVLERLLPELGLNDEILSEFPADLLPSCGEGLLSWQYPNQFAPYLCELARYPIESYLEIGARHGGTFAITVEYLNRFTPVHTALAVDIGASPTLLEYERIRPGARFAQVSSSSDEFRELVRATGRFDLVLIDGNHVEAAAWSDFETIRPHARMVAVHDIGSDACPGIAKVWSRIRREYAGHYRFLEFTAQYDDVVERTGARFLGIGLAVPLDMEPREPGPATAPASASAAR